MIYVSEKYAIFKNGSCIGIRKTRDSANRLFNKTLINCDVEKDLVEMYLNGYLICQM